MTREIKFRAWVESASKIFDWNYLVDKSDLGSVISGNYSGYHVMQYTGLKDKNGKQIYENDLVSCTNKYDQKFIYEVKWINHIAGWAYVDAACKEGEWINQLGMFDGGEEIIGNIYENPELLPQ